MHLQVDQVNSCFLSPSPYQQPLLAMNTEDYIKMHSIPRHQPQGTTTIAIAQDKASTVDHLKTKCSSETDLQAVSPATNPRPGVPKFGHSVENIYEHIQ